MSRSSAVSHGVTILAGLVLIAILTPLSQFLTMSVVNADVETGSPVAWAVGLVFSLILVLAAVRLVVRTRLLGPANLALLYAMLTLAVPVMNIGLVRQMVVSSYSMLFEYFVQGTYTYRTAHNHLTPEWFPLVPTPEGLAWNRADRLLTLLEDPQTQGRRRTARRTAETQLYLAGQGLVDEVDREALEQALRGLGPDDLYAVQDTTPDRIEEALGIRDLLAELRDARMEASREAARILPDRLAPFSEWAAQLLPANLRRIESLRLFRQKVLEETDHLPESEREALLAARDRLEQELPEVQPLVMALDSGGRSQVRGALRERYEAEYEGLSRAEQDLMRQRFVSRLSPEERQALIAQDGSGDTTNQNLHAFFSGSFEDAQARQDMRERSFRANAAIAASGIPWEVWRGPLLRWSALMLVIFLFLMCLAEWLRRKWVDRENLAFPLVDMADYMIRHDARLESAEDILHPPGRSWMFSPVFMGGFAVGLLWLSLQAMAHYGILGGGQDYVVAYDVSGQLFREGGLRNMNQVVFLLSPIAVGLLFMVSLEISVSLFTVFFLYSFGTALPAMLGATPPSDPLYTGWGGGRFYPFPTEQLLGASLVFALIVLWKSRTGRRATSAAGTGTPEASPYIPARVTTVGLIGLPVLAGVLLYHMGLTSPWITIPFGLALLALTVVAARVRAESGLPVVHTTYEFTRLPITFGLPGLAGSRSFVLFCHIVFLPWTLLFRTLPQQLENLELARRMRLRYGWVALGTLLAFVTALGVGVWSFMVMSYYHGETFFAGHTNLGDGVATRNLWAYPHWVAHFLGEQGLDQWTQVHTVRVVFMVVGMAVFGLLYFLRGRFIKFPIHPLGYLLVLLGITYNFVSPYPKAGVGHHESSLLWGSAVVAFVVKKVLIKYGGMTSYKQAKPFFIGLIVGSVFAVFAWNATDLVCSMVAEGRRETDDTPAQTTGFVQRFVDVAPFSPKLF